MKNKWYLYYLLGLRKILCARFTFKRRNFTKNFIKKNLKALLSLEQILCFIFSLIILILSIIFAFSTRNVFWSILLSFSEILLVFLIYEIFEDNLTDMLFHLHPSSIFNHGKWQYFETTESGNFNLEYISTSWNQYAIDLTNTNKSVEKICKFIEENDVYFKGLLELEDTWFRIDNLKIDKNTIIHKLKKSNSKNIKIQTTAKILLVRNTFADWECISFIKIGELKTSLLNYVKNLDLNQLLKYYLSYHEEKIEKSQFDFFNAVDKRWLDDNIIYLHKNQWMDFDENQEVKRDTLKYGENATIVIH